MLPVVIGREDRIRETSNEGDDDGAEDRHGHDQFDEAFTSFRGLAARNTPSHPMRTSPLPATVMFVAMTEPMLSTVPLPAPRVNWSVFGAYNTPVMLMFDCPLIVIGCRLNFD